MNSQIGGMPNFELRFESYSSRKFLNIGIYLCLNQYKPCQKPTLIVKNETFTGFILMAPFLYSGMPSKCVILGFRGGYIFVFQQILGLYIWIKDYV